MQSIPGFKPRIKRNENAKEHRRGVRRSPRQRAWQPHTGDFLNLRFLPKCVPSDDLPEREGAEKDFFQSMDNLANFYGFSPLPVQEYDYPYNVLMSHQYALSVLKPLGITSLVWHKASKNAGVSGWLQTSEEVDLCDVLYHIPVMPLCKLLAVHRTRKVGELLLSVFAYLYHKSCIPYYREEGSELYYYYQMFEEDLRWGEGGEDGNGASIKSDMNRAVFYGDLALRKLSNPCHLRLFRKRVENFIPTTYFEFIAADLAYGFLSLYREYPKRSIFDHVPPFEAEEEIFHPFQSLSFVCSDNSGIANQLMEYINTILQDCTMLANPTLSRYFLKPVKRKRQTGLEYERRTIGLIQRLIYLLRTTP